MNSIPTSSSNNSTNSNSNVATTNPSTASNNNSAAAAADSSSLAMDLVSLFECPVCFDYALPPIMQCHSGHIVCSSCREKLTTCPTCRATLDNIRNLAMEKLALSVQFPCKYSSNGCTNVFYCNQKSEHEEICEHRPYACPCPGASCKWSGSLEQVMNHLLSQHKSITTLQGEDIVFLATDINLPGAIDWVMMQSCFGHNFMLVLEKQMRHYLVGRGPGSPNDQRDFNVDRHRGLHGMGSTNTATVGPLGLNVAGTTINVGTTADVANTSGSSNAPGLHMQLDPLGNHNSIQQVEQFHAVVQIIGTRKLAEQFVYRLELNGPRRRLTWEATPGSIHDGVQSSISNCDCLLFDSTMANLFAENGNLGINVTIIQSNPSSTSQYP